jgi:hypothetical protein
MAYGTVNADVIGTSVANSNLGAGNATRFKNKLINSDMRIDQRNAGASVTITNTGGNTYTLDRWFAYGSAASKFSVQQNAGSVTPPVGFINYSGVTSLAATSLGAGDQYLFGQLIEGFNTADLAWGTANAKTVTLSFQIYSSLTGTFGGSFTNSTQNRSYPFTYTISSANTWTTISVTIAGDTSGTWLTTNGIGLKVFFGLGVGTTSSGTAGSWSGGNYTSATGATSVVGTSGATFYITGVQLEVGSSATGFDYVDYTTQLAMCQRYYWKTNSSTSNNFICWVYAANTTDAYGYLYFPVSMRTSPTAVTYVGTGWWAGGAVTATTITIAENGIASVTLRFTSTGYSSNVVYAILPNGSSNNYLALTAEL